MIRWGWAWRALLMSVALCSRWVAGSGGVVPELFVQTFDHEAPCGCEDEIEPEAGSPIDPEHPHIVFVHADDLGYHDIGINDPGVKTPNLDKLARDGVILSNSYSAPGCSSSRSAFMTGKYPFKTQMQHGLLEDVNPHCVPTNIPFLPQHLAKGNYRSHLVGKWDLGYCKWECTPTYRGFDSFTGCYGAMSTQMSHLSSGAYDWRSDKDVDRTAQEDYSTYIIRDRAEELIFDNPLGKPLFMWLSFLAPHKPHSRDDEAEDYYPDEEEPRKTYLGMITDMDQAIGEIVDILQDLEMWNNTLFVFTSDNGAESGGHGSNAPFRGGKGSLYEGGSRVVTFVSGPLVNAFNYTHKGLFHSVDWVPTLLSIANIKDCDKTLFDGLDQSDMILRGGPSARDQVILNIDIEPEAIFGNAAIRIGDYKMIWGHPGFYDGYGKNLVPVYHNPRMLALINKSNDDYHDVPDERPNSNWMSNQESDLQRQIMEAVGIAGITEETRGKGMVQLFDLAADISEEINLVNDAKYEGLIDQMKDHILKAIKEGYVSPQPEASKMYTSEANPLNFKEPDLGSLTPGWCTSISIVIPDDNK